MQPDLFSGPLQRDDSFRVLARLANGGAVPAPARQWRLDRRQRVRLAAIFGLLAMAAVAWLWLRSGVQPVRMPPSTGTPHAIAPPAGQLAEAAPEPQAAMIVSQEEAPAAVADTAGGAAASAVAPAIPAPERNAARMRRPGPAAPNTARTTGGASATAATRPARGAAPQEHDEDVTLLAAMLRHAKPQKPPDPASAPTAAPPPKAR